MHARLDLHLLAVEHEFAGQPARPQIERLLGGRQICEFGVFSAFNGTKGRLEHQIVEQAFTAGATLPPGAEKDAVHTRIIPLRGKPEELEPWTGQGGHGGGDAVMLAEVFGTAEPDKYKRAADERSGLYSILIGAAANRCFSSGQAVKIADLVKGLTPPEVAPMPNRETKVPMPLRV